MKKLYDIKPGHPIVEFIRQEMLNTGYYKKGIGICAGQIDSRSLCSTDLYGLKFDGNNWNVPCINFTYYSDFQVDDAPIIITKDMRGYDYYMYSCSCTIKLKTFLEKNPQWSEIEDWTVSVKYKEKKCEYDGHNSGDRQVSIKRPDGKYYIVDFPPNVKSDSSVLKWVKPMELQLTKIYYRKKKLDQIHNIKRNLSVWVEGITFKYDYYDGVIVIHDIFEKNSIYHVLTKSKLLDIGIGIPDSTKEKIKEEIEKRDLEVKNVVLGKYKPRPTKIKVCL